MDRLKSSMLGPLAEALTGLKAVPLLAYMGTAEVARVLGSGPGQLVPLEGPLPPAQRVAVRSFPDVAPGDYNVYAAKPTDRTKDSEPVTVEAGRTTEVTMTLKR